MPAHSRPAAAASPRRDHPKRRQAKPSASVSPGGSFVFDLARQNWLCGLALLGIVLVCYLPSLSNGFTWDDDTHLTENILTSENGLYRTWLTTQQPNYWPITWTSYWIEWKTWGRNPLPFHVTNVLLHALNTLLVWRILKRLGIRAAWLCALVFGLHPVAAEAAAWITQRKTLLAMCFFLGSALLFLRAEQERRDRFYYASLGMFLLGLLSKGSIVTLPVVLLGYAYWSRGEIRWQDVKRSLPFFVLAGCFSLVEIYFQRYRAIQDTVIRTDGFLSRLIGASWAVWFYAYKLLFPLNTYLPYPRWRIDTALFRSYAPLFALVLLFGVLWAKRKTFGRSPIFGAGFFVVMLFPVLGFFDIYYMRYSLVADHWQYSAMAGLITVAVSSAAWFCCRPGIPAGFRVAAVLLIPASLFALTWQRQQVFRDPETLFLDTLKRDPAARLAHINLGHIYSQRRDLDRAIHHYRESLRMDPGALAERYSLAVTYWQAKMLPQAASELREVLRHTPGNFEALNLLGLVLQDQHRWDDALAQYRKALEVSPRNFEALTNLGIVMKEKGDRTEAVRHLEAALQENPNYPTALYFLGKIHAEQGQLDMAIAELKHAIAWNPGLYYAYNQLGAIYMRKGDSSAAAEAFRKSIAINPQDGEASRQLQRIEQPMN